MVQHLPVGDIKFLTDKELENFNVLDVSDDSNNGYAIEFDLEYPDELHELHCE